MLVSGKKGGTESGVNRVRVPYSKGFAFSVRPPGRDDVSPDKHRGAAAAAAAGAPNETRDKLAKRMQVKGRTQGKNQRSANISLEGRATKG